MFVWYTPVASGALVQLPVVPHNPVVVSIQSFVVGDCADTSCVALKIAAVIVAAKRDVARFFMEKMRVKPTRIHLSSDVVFTISCKERRRLYAVAGN